MNVKRAIVGGLNTACTLVDELAYRPAVVKLTLRLPRWWQCDLAKLSMRLDDHWRTGYWDDDPAPAAPGELCLACGRRAAIFTVGAYDERFDEDLPEPHKFLGHRPIHVCGWCQLWPFAPITDEESLAQALADARERSIRWTWKWRLVESDPMSETTSR